jgi:spermidine synthase
MTKAFEELAYSKTTMGELTLRRRRLPGEDTDIFEIKLDDEFLMSSQFTVSETALVELALNQAHSTDLNVVVGGLGLGYTARSVLGYSRVRSLAVIERFQEVIDWHRKEVVPLGRALTSDQRCQLYHGDFFAIFSVPFQERSGDIGGRKHHAVLVDIDHSPAELLHDSHASFYQEEGLRTLATHLHPGGVFALWSNDPPDKDFLRLLRVVFYECDARVVSFDNPLQNRTASSTIYVARTGHDLAQCHRQPS